MFLLIKVSLVIVGTSDETMSSFIVYRILINACPCTSLTFEMDPPRTFS